MRFLAGFLVGLLVVVFVGAAVVYTGSYNVAASTPPSRMETKLASFALNKAVARRASNARNPFPVSAEVLRDGFDHYKEMCVVCHGAPGVDVSELGQGLNPPAPDLTLPRVQGRTDGEMFWIVCNGIKMTGMPAFCPTHKTDQVWKIVAFVRHLEQLTPEEQKSLKAATEEAEHGHEEGEAAPGTETKEGEPPAAVATPGHTHDPGTAPHKD